MGGCSSKAKRTAREMQCVSLDPSYLKTFTEKVAASVPLSATDEALVITADIGEFEVRHMLVDNGSSADLLYYDAFKRMRIEESKLLPVDVPLVGFSGGTVYSRGAVTLPFQLGEGGMTVSCTTTFLLVDISSVYNVIMGRPTLNMLRAIPSTYH